MTKAPNRYRNFNRTDVSLRNGVKNKNINNSAEEPSEKKRHTPQRASKMNLAAYIAYCGICSRRDAEDLISSGHVRVGKNLITDLAYSVNTNLDEVYVNDFGINLISEPRLFILNKPKGVIVSSGDTKDRKTVYSLIPKNLPRLIYVGRLDYNSEGLLLMTNYGPLAHYLESPSNKIERVYHVKIFGEWRQNISEILLNGARIEGFKYGPIKVKVISSRDKQTWLECSLCEGKNRELRKVFSHFGFLVSKLKRIQYGHFHLGTLNPGEILECKKHVVQKIMNEIKAKADRIEKETYINCKNTLA